MPSRCVCSSAEHFSKCVLKRTNKWGRGAQRSYPLCLTELIIFNQGLYVKMTGAKACIIRVKEQMQRKATETIQSRIVFSLLYSVRALTSRTIWHVLIFFYISWIKPLVAANLKMMSPPVASALFVYHYLTSQSTFGQSSCHLIGTVTKSHRIHYFFWDVLPLKMPLNEAETAVSKAACFKKWAQAWLTSTASGK